MLAARRYGVSEVILCASNAHDVEEIDKAHLLDLKVTYVRHMEEVIDAALLDANA